MCIKQVFLLADHFSLHLFWGSGLFWGTQKPHVIWLVSAESALQLEVSSLRLERLLFRTEKHFKLMALLQWIPFQKTEQQQAYRSQFLYTLPYPLWLLWRLNNFRVEKVWMAFALSILVRCFFNELPHFQLATSSISSFLCAFTLILMLMKCGFFLKKTFISSCPFFVEYETMD